jgi:O6-methylguanine-DNA--protein-cysteine methyltransferase
MQATMHGNTSAEIISYAIGDCALGRVLIARSVSGVCAILIGTDNDEVEADLATRFPNAWFVANDAVVHDDLAKVIRFVDKPAEGLHVALVMRGNPFQRRVWEKLCAFL